MNYYLTLFTIVITYMTLGFIVSLIKKRNDIADVLWGLGFVIISWTAYIISNNNQLINTIINILVTIGGLRLALHIYERNKKKAEDYRYAEWRIQWGKWFYIRSYLQVFILQGVLLFLIATPVLILNNKAPETLNNLSLIGILIWIIGFTFETVGDKQLSNFIKDPNNKGKVLDSGLWKYSRHPNYFGEVTQWWGISIVTLITTGTLLSLIGPLTITFLILKVSGIPLLENKMLLQKEFQEYAKKN